MYRKNIDDRLRAAMRLRSQDPSDIKAQAHLLRLLMHAGIINPRYASLAAYLGHPIAQMVVDLWIPTADHQLFPVRADKLRAVLLEGEIEKDLLVPFARDCAERALRIAWVGVDRTGVDLPSLPNDILQYVEELLSCDAAVTEEIRETRNRGEPPLELVWEPCIRIEYKIQRNLAHIINTITQGWPASGNFLKSQRKAANAAFNVGAAVQSESIRGHVSVESHIFSATRYAAESIGPRAPHPDRSKFLAEIDWQINHLMHYLLNGFDTPIT